ncbi:SDR family NAD(P)-dependent oxidoreductase [Plectonema radiosum NIES-515]|uniref:SDR family NAD(P)-dependent oxidoreductase n=1 Tax=Plectonema radiosum NIES-515 TaxID=2986073 RepID=A0ABT3B6G6_9CYAN|nr:SDR family NAD(P)-dependent oxidoreductase [Plectonema radiosum]MCV3216967.1 SDR family NAD(P)-dependent oxidoreductase [Plectonema radiosum NIES-515]
MLFNELQLLEAENQVVLGNGERYVARLVAHQSKQQPTPSPTEPFQVKLSEYGNLNNIQLVSLLRRPPGPGEVEIEVDASALNFRDVLNALGMLKEHYAEHLGIHQAKDVPLGFECAGKIVRVGSGDCGFKVGDEVMAIADGSFASFVTLLAAKVVHKPSELSFEEAATIPNVFLTAMYALQELANIQPGDRVLIHAGAGGVGQAAVQLAQAVGAEVFVTASPTKWEFLKAQGIEETHIMNSRTLAFASELMTKTKGKGVDIVLNSLSGEFIEQSFAVLAVGGRFVELGKMGIWDHQKVAQCRPDVAYYSFDLGDVFNLDPELITKMLAQVSDWLADGKIKPLPHKVFPAGDATEAFRYMQRAKHIGKVVLAFNSQTKQLIRGDSTYLVTGGLGGLGLLVARFLVEHGAKHLVLVGRSAAETTAKNQLKELEQLGSQVVVVQADVSNREQMARAIADLTSSLPPLRGIVHAAGILDDGILQQLTWERFTRVMAPKVIGVWNLHTLTKDQPLEFLVFFSSASSLLGSAGQANYAAANAFLDALASYRRGQGLPALSINWGAWSEAGMADRLQITKQLHQKGEGYITPQQGLQVLEQLLKEQSRHELSQVGVLPINWPKFLESIEQGKVQATLPFFADFTKAFVSKSAQVLLPGEVIASSNRNQVHGYKFRQLLENSSAEKRVELLRDYVCTQVAEVLELSSPKQVELTQRFIEIGLDSLMTMELRSRLQANLGCTLPSTLVFDYPTVELLVDYLYQEILYRADSDNSSQRKDSTLVPVKPHGSKPPFFFVSGILGQVFALDRLAHYLDSEQPFYGLRSLGLEEGETPYTQITEIAAHHIKAIQAIQPTGPYRLGGHSFGGRVAFEMGQQLLEQEQKVSFLAILDIPAITNSHKHGGTSDYTLFTITLAHIYEGVLEKNLDISSEHLKNLSLDEQVRYLGESLQRAGQSLNEAEIQRVWQVCKSNTLADMNYLLQSHYDTLITLFRASELSVLDFLPNETETEKEPSWGWGKLSTSPLELHIIPGNHFTMMNEPQVQVLAKQLQTCLDRVQID